MGQLQRVFAVQLVELASSPIEQLLGGTYAIRICLMDPKSDMTCAVTVNKASAEELDEYIRMALESHSRLNNTTKN